MTILDDTTTGIKRPDGLMYGFITQDLQELWPTKVKKDGLGYLQTGYSDYDPMFVESIKALKNKILDQEKTIESLKNQNQSKDDEVQSLKAEVN